MKHADDIIIMLLLVLQSVPYPKHVNLLIKATRPILILVKLDLHFSDMHYVQMFKSLRYVFELVLNRVELNRLHTTSEISVC